MTHIELKIVEPDGSYTYSTPSEYVYDASVFITQLFMQLNLDVEISSRLIIDTDTRDAETFFKFKRILMEEELRALQTAADYVLDHCDYKNKYDDYDRDLENTVSMFEFYEAIKLFRKTEEA